MTVVRRFVILKFERYFREFSLKTMLVQLDVKLSFSATPLFRFRLSIFKISFSQKLLGARKKF